MWDTSELYARVEVTGRLPFPATSRGRCRDVALGGYQLPAGSQVYVAPYVIHRDERWWHHPELYQPERWLSAQPPHARYSYVPFGSGPRYCAGGHLGLVQVTLLLAEMITNYRISVPKASDVRKRCRSILLPDDLRARWDTRPDA
ncbi:cytochrome P450 [Kibdelosporangium lantanae]|uniref:Cytochrome P450 n=1 Tax=Kibdelosporangium lantanae TaxID=1497396 RepID=A0ABW3ME58_9PSEU